MSKLPPPDSFESIGSNESGATTVESKGSGDDGEADREQIIREIAELDIENKELDIQINIARVLLTIKENEAPGEMMSLTNATKGAELTLKALDDGEQEFAQLDILQGAFSNLQRKKEELIANKIASVSKAPTNVLEQERTDLEVTTEEKRRMLDEIVQQSEDATKPEVMFKKHGAKNLFDRLGGRRRRTTLRKKGKGKGKGKKSMRRKGRKTVKRRKTNRRRRTMQK
uniref:Uncharacterized protein n=1 Tax=viral metagenome TaxID=1070528 RepID=A0A6C0B0G8_9ZZZZ